MIELPAQVISRSGDTRIEAVGANFATTADGVVLHLENAKTTCTGVCVGDLSAGEDLILSAEVVVLQPESGVIVPLSAIVVDGSGTPKLVMEDGSLRDIEIGNRDAGYAIVSGVADGERVRALGR